MKTSWRMCVMSTSNFMMPIISDLPLAMLKRKWMEEVTEMMLYVSTTSSMVRGPDSWLVRKVKYSSVGTGQEYFNLANGVPPNLLLTAPAARSIFQRN